MLSSDPQALFLRASICYIWNTLTQPVHKPLHLLVIYKHLLLHAGTELLALYWVYFLPSPPSLDSMVYYFKHSLASIHQIHLAKPQSYMISTIFLSCLSTYHMECY